jgi:hypothetical protein
MNGPATRSRQARRRPGRVIVDLVAEKVPHLVAEVEHRRMPDDGDGRRNLIRGRMDVATVCSD